MTRQVVYVPGFDPANPTPFRLAGAARNTCAACGGSGLGPARTCDVSSDGRTVEMTVDCLACDGLGWSVSIPEALTPKVVRGKWSAGLKDGAWWSGHERRLVLSELHIAVEQWRWVEAGYPVWSSDPEGWLVAEHHERRQALVAVLTDYEALPVLHPDEKLAVAWMPHVAESRGVMSVWRKGTTYVECLGRVGWDIRPLDIEAVPGDVVVFPGEVRVLDPEPLTRPCSCGAVPVAPPAIDMTCADCGWTGRVPVVLEPDQLTEVES